MSNRTGPYLEILTAHTIVSTAAIVCTPIELEGNSLTLEIHVLTGGVGGITLTAERSLVGGLAYGSVISGGEVWSYEVTAIDTVGVYSVSLPLALAVEDVIKISITPTNAAGEISVSALNYEDSGASGGATTGTGDSVVDDTVDTVSLAVRTEQINKDSAEALHIYLVEEANVAADTYRVMWDRKRFLSGAIQWDISGGVTLKIYATSSQDADTTSLTGWHDVTDLLTGSVTQVDNDDVAYYDTDLVSVAFMVQYVTSDTTNDVNVWVSESKK